MTTPAAGGRVVVAAAVCSVVGFFLPVAPPGSFVAVDALVVLAWLVDLVLAPPPGRMSVERHAPASLALGSTAPLVWRVANRSGRSCRVAVADELAPSLRAGRRRVLLSLEPGDTADATTVLAPERRGDFRPARVVVRTYGPLRLAGRQATRSLPGHIRVVPSFRSRKQAELRMDRGRVLVEGRRAARSRGGGSEFDQLRDYTVDDESRRIDWAATARAGRPIVRTYRAERNQQVMILLDNGRLMAGTLDGAPRVEHAMDAAMALTAVATRMGDRVGLLAFDRRVRAALAPGATPDQLRRLVDAVYALEPVLAESDYRRAFVELAARQRRRSLVVLLTELADQALEATLLADLPLLTARHLVVVAAARDPAVEEWAAGPAPDAGTAYRQAAAIRALDGRARLAALLAGRGVDVVDARPGRLAASLVDRYLEVKAAARL